MATDQAPPARQTFPVGTFAILALAGICYVGMLASIRPSASGEAVVGAALFWLFLTAALWLLLTVLLIVGGMMGRMPRAAGWALVVLQPLIGAALIVSGDFYSRHRQLPPVEPALLPLLAAFYAVWARFTSLHDRLPPLATSLVVLGLIGGISVVSLVAAANY